MIQTLVDEWTARESCPRRDLAQIKSWLENNTFENPVHFPLMQFIDLNFLELLKLQAGATSVEVFC